jgi:hypothetical protein
MLVGGITSPTDTILDAVTPDELTIAWTAGAVASRAIYVADRASTSASFGSPQAISASAFAADRAALSPDGLRLVVVNADRQGFSELTRASRSATFGSPGTGFYGNFDMAGALPSGEAYGDPVLDAYDEVFYYSQYPTQVPDGGSGDAGAATPTIYSTARLLPTDPWPQGAPLSLDSSMSLGEVGGRLRRPTGVSADVQTLFFWDEMSATERVAWMNVSTGVYDTFVDLGSREMAAPNLSCTVLYYSAPGVTSTLDLFYAAAQ